METAKGARRARIAAWLFTALWAVAFLGAFVAFALTPARDFGFTAGMNRVTVFLGGQVVASALAIPAAIAARRLPKGAGLRWLALVPIWMVGALAALVAALIVWAALQRPPAGTAPPPGPVTAPAEAG